MDGCFYTVCHFDLTCPTTHFRKNQNSTHSMMDDPFDDDSFIAKSAFHNNQQDKDIQSSKSNIQRIFKCAAKHNFHKDVVYHALIYLERIYHTNSAKQINESKQIADTCLLLGLKMCQTLESNFIIPSQLQRPKEEAWVLSALEWNLMVDSKDNPLWWNEQFLKLYRQVFEPNVLPFGIDTGRRIYFGVVDCLWREKRPFCSIPQICFEAFMVLHSSCRSPMFSDQVGQCWPECLKDNHSTNAMNNIEENENHRYFALNNYTLPSMRQQ